jgi:hypothetical protein
VKFRDIAQFHHKHARDCTLGRKCKSAGSHNLRRITQLDCPNLSEKLTSHKPQRKSRKCLRALAAPFGEASRFHNLILLDRRVPVDTHGAGGGRNWADPVTRHRNTGCCSERIAHFLHGLHDPLRLCREHYAFARISSKCRCAKCEREHDTRAPNRRTAQATKPVFHSHAVIVVPFRILSKLI